MRHIARGHSDRKYPAFLVGARIQVRVIRALMLKEALARYGHENLGFFWVVGEPLLLTCGIMLVWSIIGATHGSEIGIVPFALTGYTFITVWRHIVAKSLRVMRHKASLAYHRQIKFLDSMIANALLECLAVFTAFVVAYIPLSLLGLCPPMRDGLEVVMGFALTAWFAFSFGLIVAALSEFFEVMHHLMNPIMYLTLPITGTFFMVDWLPEKTQKIVLWSPLVNCVEMVRGGLFPLEFPTHGDPTFVAVCAAGLMAVGLFLCKIAERHIMGE